ncbi:MAG: MMPL family transporter [Longimicrobiales bacterium]|nr:MMPL family transporter [Longimicrobiales bacterium]
MQHLCRLVPRSYRWTLLIALVTSAAGGYLASKLRLESDLAALLPHDFPSVQALDDMEAEVGGAVSKLRIVLVSQDFPALLRFAEALHPRLEASESVLYAQFENETAFYEKNALLFLDPAELDSLYDAVQREIDAAKQSANPFMIDDLFGPPPSESEEEGGDDLEALEAKYADVQPKPYFTNPDSTVLVVEVAAARESVDLDFSRALLEEVQGIVAAEGPERYAADMEVYFGGNIKNRIDEYDTLRSDIFGTAAYGLAGVFLLMVLYFRSLVPPILIAVSLLGSLAWTFGLTYLLIGELNTITGFLFVVLFGLGIDYGIHAFARYRETRQAGHDRGRALHDMVCHTGRALATTTFTTAAAFFSLLLMDFKGFSELGLITGVGLIFALVAMIWVLPGMVVASEKIGLLRIAAVPGKSLDFTPRPYRPARRILVVAGVVTVFAAAAFTQVKFQYDFTDLRIITPEREMVGQLTADVFTRSESPALILTDSEAHALAVEARVREIMAADSVTPTVDQVRSIHSLVPSDQRPRLERIRAIRTLIAEEDATSLLSGDDLERLERLRGYLAVDEPVTFDDVPPNELRPFTKRDGEVGSFVFIYPSVALRDGRNAILFKEDIGEVTLPSGEVFQAASSNLVLADLLQMVIREGRLAVGLSFLVVFLIVLADVRSLRDTLLILSPLILGMLWVGGAMVALGMQLNLFNMVVLPSIIGIGVDTGVHIQHRYRSEGSGSLHLVLRRTGPAVAIATITTIVGYTGLLMASHPGLQSIGKLAILGLGLTLASALIVLPALLQVTEPGNGDSSTPSDTPSEGV